MVKVEFEKLTFDIWEDIPLVWCVLVFHVQIRISCFNLFMTKTKSGILFGFSEQRLSLDSFWIDSKTPHPTAIETSRSQEQMKISEGNQQKVH